MRKIIDQKIIHTRSQSRRNDSSSIFDELSRHIKENLPEWQPMGAPFFREMQIRSSYTGNVLDQVQLCQSMVKYEPEDVIRKI